MYNGQAEVGVRVALVAWTGSLFPAYAAARLCYKRGGFAEIERPDDEAEMGRWLRDNVLRRGHWGIAEHLTFTFAIGGISRACSHQLVRHRIASYAQQSQRYVDKSHFRYVVPPRVAQAPEALALYRTTMAELGERYAALQKLLHAADPEAKRADVNQDARFVLPNACETELVMTLNGRQVVEVCRKRLCSRAQWEIRALFGQVREILQGTVPVVFDNLGPDCAWGACSEGGCSAAGRHQRSPGWK